MVVLGIADLGINLPVLIGAVVNGMQVIRILARLVNLRGTPSCASEAVKEPNELLRALRTLELCRIDAAEFAADTEGPVRGRSVERALQQIATLLIIGFFARCIFQCRFGFVECLARVVKASLRTA